MRLTLSSKSVCNAVFTDETNQVVYKTSCPLFGNLTTIYKAVLRNAASGKAPSGGTTFVRNNHLALSRPRFPAAAFSSYGHNAGSISTQDQLNVVGEMEWHMFGSSILRIHGEEIQSNDLLPSRWNRADTRRIFTGPDGSSYRWDILPREVVLSRNDGSNTEVARYHRCPDDITDLGAKPYLDIDPSVTQVLDLVVLTFVYVEKTRMERYKWVDIP